MRKKSIGLLALIAVVFMGMSILSCGEEKADLPPVFPIGYVNVELSDSSPETVQSLKANVILDFDEVRGIRDELDSKRNEIIAAIKEVIAMKASTDVMAMVDSGDLSAEISEKVNSLLSKPAITSVTLEDTEVVMTEAAMMGDEE